MITQDQTKLIKLVRSQKLKDLKDALNIVLGAGYDYNGNTFSLKDQTTENVALKIRCPPGMKNKNKFFDKNHRQVDFGNANAFDAFRDAIFIQKDAVMVRYNELYEQIDLALNVDAINAIVIDFTNLDI